MLASALAIRSTDFRARYRGYPVSRPRLLTSRRPLSVPKLHVRAAGRNGPRELRVSNEPGEDHGRAGRSISVRDLVAADLRYRDRTGELYLVQEESPRHRWAYFSEMDRNEALVFKQYDSQVNGVARFTPHSAFDLPDIPPDAPLRQSIEIRCLVTYS